MSAVEEYREHRRIRLLCTEDMPPDDEVNGDVADAAIADLLERLEKAEDDLHLLRNVDAAKFAVAMHERAEQAEAERDAATAMMQDFRRQMKKARARAEHAEAEIERLRQAADRDMKRLVAEGGRRIRELESFVAKYKWMTHRGLVAEYGSTQLDAEYEAHLMTILEEEYETERRQKEHNEGGHHE